MQVIPTSPASLGSSLSLPTEPTGAPAAHAGQRLMAAPTTPAHSSAWRAPNDSTGARPPPSSTRHTEHTDTRTTPAHPANGLARGEDDSTRSDAGDADARTDAHRGRAAIPSLESTPVPSMSEYPSQTMLFVPGSTEAPPETSPATRSHRVTDQDAPDGVVHVTHPGSEGWRRWPEMKAGPRVALASATPANASHRLRTYKAMDTVIVPASSDAEEAAKGGPAITGPSPPPTPLTSRSASTHSFVSLRSLRSDGGARESDMGSVLHRSHCRPHPPAESFDLCMDGVSLSVSSLGCRPLRRRHTLLSHVSAFIPAGTLCCVLSIHQRNASAVLSTLAGVEEGAEGTVLANALPTSARVFRPYVAFISSIHGIDTEETVRGNLLFSIRMRLAFVGGEGEEARRVAFAAEMTLLSRLLDTRAKELTRGQQFQLALAMELVRDPAVVLLDGPLMYFGHAEVQVLLAILTNLLSDATPSRCEHIPSPIAEGSSGGGALAHTHAPSGNTWRRVVVLSATDVPLPLYGYLDSLLVLDSSGRVVYSGETLGLELFFHRDLGIPNAYGEQIADLLAQMEDSGSTEVMADKYRLSAACARLHERLRHHHRRAAHGVVAHGHAEGADGAAAADSLSRRDSTATHSFSFTGEASGVPGYAEQLRLLTVFTLRKHFLRKAFLVPWACLLAVFVLLSSFLGAAAMGDSNAVQNLSGVIFILLSCSMLVNVIFLDAEVEEYNSFVHLRGNSYFRVSQYAITTVLRLVLPRIILAVLVSLFALLALGSAAVPLALLMALTTLAHASLFIVLVYWMPTQAALAKLWYAQHWYYGYCVVCSGFIVNLSSVPRVFQFTSLLRIGYGGLVATVMRGSTFGCVNESDSGSTHTPASSSSVEGEGLQGGSGAWAPLPCFTGDQYLNARGMNAIGWGPAAGILAGVSVALVLLHILSMYMTWAPRRH